MKHIRTINREISGEKTEKTDCSKCRTACRPACRTSCTVTSQKKAKNGRDN